MQEKHKVWFSLSQVLHCPTQQAPSMGLLLGSLQVIHVFGLFPSHVAQVS